jgi:hypothetical protein
MKKFSEKIEKMLMRGDYAKVITLMLDWLCGCQPGDPGRLLDVCSPKLRSSVELLLRDLLTNYPKILLGCPLMLYAIQDNDNVVSASGLGLPFPRPRHACPCEGLWFVGWLRSELKPPIYLPVSMEPRHNTLIWNNATSFVALFCASEDLLDTEQMQIPAEWWGDLFMKGLNAQPVGNVRIEGDLLLSYPDALEVAVAQQAGARGEPMPACGHFQQDLVWAYEAGIRFGEDCRIQFMSPDI